MACTVLYVPCSLDNGHPQHAVPKRSLHISETLDASVHLHLTQCIDSSVLESQIPHKTVKLMF